MKALRVAVLAPNQLRAVLMGGTWTEAQFFTRWGYAVRRAAHPPFSYLRAHAVEDPQSPPATLPGEQGETVTLWMPTYEDTMATDWRLY